MLPDTNPLKAYPYRQAVQQTGSAAVLIVLRSEPKMKREAEIRISGSRQSSQDHAAGHIRTKHHTCL